MQGHGTPSRTPQTSLSHVGDSTPPVGFLQFWSGWQDRAFAGSPALSPIDGAEVASAGAPGVTHTITSPDGIRVGCRLLEPQNVSPRGVVITLHGYTTELQEPLRTAPSFSRAAIAHMDLRVRGYPGSQFDTGDLMTAPSGFIGVGIESAPDWAVSGAVTDVVSAFRALRARYGPALPISIHAESFGGGLAIIAASMIAARDSVHRLALGVPTLGDWAWRLGNPAAMSGAGADILKLIERSPASRDTILHTLRLFDAVVHARRVTCPVVCKIARKDPVVPPETVASIYNALGAAPGWKWRFVTETAHMDCPHDDLRRHALFECLAEEFVDPAEYPQTLMSRWEPLLANGNDPPVAPPKAA